MMHEAADVAGRLAAAVELWRNGGDFAALLDELQQVRSSASVEAIVAAAEPFLSLPEVCGPLYEEVVARRPHDARALVVLAGAWWLAGRGPEAVGELASRALVADPDNRGAWHLWALTEANPRLRMERWLQVTQRFPDDQLARANLADNAGSVANSENDPVALAMAIESYEGLLALARRPEEKEALASALSTLRSWRF
jgi:hypothetical protein